MIGRPIQFVYTPAHLGLGRDWQSPGELALDLPITEDPYNCDLFVVPCNLKHFPTRESLYKELPYFRGREDQHVIMGLDENTTSYDLPCIFLRPNLTVEMLARDENSICIPWPVEDLKRISTPNAGPHDVSFHGWMSCDVRRRAVKSVQHSQLKSDIIPYPDFFGHQDIKEREKRRMLYLGSLHQSRVALCPESIPGNIPYRFYEAMSAGRVPVLVSSGYVLPLIGLIDWSCIHEVNSRDASYCAGLIEAYLAVFRGTNLVNEGHRCRRAWEQCLDPRVWPKSFALAVEHKYRQINEQKRKAAGR